MKIKFFCPGPKFSNFIITKPKFRTKQVQETHFENGLRNEKVIVFYYPQSP